MQDQSPIPSAAERPSGINHVVLNVRDIEESHRFWTEILGFQQVGAGRRHQMRFYSADHAGKLSHHDIALVETPDLPHGRSALNHVAIAMPNSGAWLRQLHFLRSRGVAFAARVNRGVSHSVTVHDPSGHEVEILYELPRENWEGDIQAALDWARPLPTEGEGALADVPDMPLFAAPQPQHI